MKRLNDREVELTDEEMRASDYFDQQLDEGLSTPQAVAATRQRYESVASSDRCLVCQRITGMPTAPCPSCTDANNTAGHVKQLSEEFWAYLGE